MIKDKNKYYFLKNTTFSIRYYILFTILFQSILFLSVIQVKSQDFAAEIKINGIKQDTVDFGSCYKTDSLKVRLIVNNKGLKSITFDKQLGLSRFDTNPALKLYSEFSINNTVHSIIKSGQIDTLYILFIPNPLLSSIKGIRIADLRLNLVNIENPSQMIQDTVLLICRESDKYLGIFNDTIDFQNVYLGRNFKASIPLKLQNLTKNNIEILEDAKFNLLTNKVSEDEFSYDSIKKGYILVPRTDQVNNIASFNINYSPQDLSFDEANYFLKYKYTLNDTSRIDSLKIDIRGMGVIQKLDLSSTNLGKIYYGKNNNIDTIDIGSIEVNQGELLIFILKNTGNLPIIADSGFQNVGQVSQLKRIYINKEFGIINNFLNPNLSDTVYIGIDTVLEYGRFNTTYSIKTKLDNRNITGWSESDLYFKVAIRGIAKKPKLIFSPDSLNFESVALSDSCLKNAIKNIKISNIGTSDIDKLEITIESNNNYFQIMLPNPVKLNIMSDSVISISYNPTKYQSDSAKLKVLYHFYNVYDSTFIYLFGRGVPLNQATISIDSFAYYPGTEFIMPIKVSAQSVQFAKNFKDTLQFEPSMLKYIDFEIENTAIESRSNVQIEDFKNGKLFLNLRQNSNKYFLSNDNLIKLKFKNYLGSQSSTGILFTNPLFSDDNCPKVMTLKTVNGFFKTDSVCGLDYKLISKLPKVVGVNIFPTPAETDLNLLLTFDNYNRQSEKSLGLIDNKISIQIFDSFGNLLSSNNILVEETDYSYGERQIHLSIDNLFAGIYLIEINYQNQIIHKLILKK